MLRMLTRKPLLAALAAAVAATPAGLALAADPPAARAPAVPDALRAPLAGDRTAADAMRGHLRERLEARYVRAVRRHAQLSGRRVSRRAAERRAREMRPGALRAAARELRAEARELDVPVPPVMYRIAQCESRGDPRAIGGGGAFRGALQFMRSTWESVGGEGDPAAAPLEEQLRRGAILMARSGSSPWPHCGA